VTKPAGSVLDDVEFELRISYREILDDESELKLELKPEIEAALWAWETFGGIGARTRRGFGALQNLNANVFPSQEMKKKINAGLDRHVKDGTWPGGVPHLSKKLHFKTKPKTNPTTAWEYLFQQLKVFRQERYPGSISPFGRSKWPEPDAIRRLPGIPSAANHKTPRSKIDKFPRGQFGLPIIFKFKDDDKGDPAPTTLQGVKISENKYIDRLASPLILRPIACSDGAVGLAAILEWKPVGTDEEYTPPGGLWLTSKDYGDFQVESDLDISDAKNIEPLKDVDNGNPQPDVLQAFLDFLK